MDLGIKVASLYDNKTGNTGFLYELNLVENGDLLPQKSLNVFRGNFNSDNKTEAENTLSLILQSHINEIKTNYDVDSLTIFHRPIGFLESSIKNKNNQINFKVIMNPQVWTGTFSTIIKNMKLLNENKNKEIVDNKGAEILTNELEEQKKEIKNEGSRSSIQKFQIPKRKTTNKEKEPENETENETEIVAKKSSLDIFMEKQSNRESLQQSLLIKKILELDEIQDVFMDFGVTIEKERKRIGVLTHFYESEDQMRLGKGHFHKTESIGHGEINCAMYKIKKQLKSTAEFLMANGKKLKANVNISCEYQRKSFEDFLKRSELEGKIEVTYKATGLNNKANSKLSSKINKQISLYLNEIRDPRTVAIFTDGSVNKKENLSGSSAIIKFDGRCEVYSSTNSGNPDTTYAEFKAIAIALREIEKNSIYKNKKIIIVSDNDLMSYSIRNALAEPSLKKIDRPYLNEICEIINRNDINIKFHNVKSHVHDKVDKKDFSNLIDFLGNVYADHVARVAAGINQGVSKSLKSGLEFMNKKRI